jgi:hypothetical protein
MAAVNPEIIELTEPDAWTPVAENIQSGFVHILDPNVVYYQTFRLVSNPGTAPDSDTSPGDADFEGAVIYYRVDRIAGESVPIGGALIGSTEPIKFYIYVSGGPGRVRLDKGA